MDKAKSLHLAVVEQRQQQWAAAAAARSVANFVTLYLCNFVITLVGGGYVCIAEASPDDIGGGYVGICRRPKRGFYYTYKPTYPNPGGLCTEITTKRPPLSPPTRIEPMAQNA